MSLERILIIKQNQKSSMAACKRELEYCTERYAVSIANNYEEGTRLFREISSNESGHFNAVLIDTETVDTSVLELIASIQGSDYCFSMIVMTGTADDETRKALSSAATECVIKTGKYIKFLWHVVKSSLERNNRRPSKLLYKARILKVFTFNPRKRPNTGY